MGMDGDSYCLKVNMVNVHASMLNACNEHVKKVLISQEFSSPLFLN